MTPTERDIATASRAERTRLERLLLCILFSSYRPFRVGYTREFEMVYFYKVFKGYHSI